MKLNLTLLGLSFVLFGVFTLFSYTVAKEFWQKVDFDTTIKLQDHLSRRLDEPFSLLSLLGSAEITLALAGILAFINLVQLKFFGFIAWLLIVPATVVEVAGKLVIYHPSPPNFLLRTVDLEKNLPHFNVHTDFSYPSGHVTRTTFLIVLTLVLVYFSSKNSIFKSLLVLTLVGGLFLMVLSRVYLGEHWLSDVLGGGLLGASSAIFAGALIVRSNKNNH